MRIYGIDLGTTYSCIAFVNENNKAEMINNADGEMTTPSVVYFESPDNIVVGKQAKNSGKLYPDRTVASSSSARWGTPNTPLISMVRPTNQRKSHPLYYGNLSATLGPRQARKSQMWSLRARPTLA